MKLVNQYSNEQEAYIDKGFLKNYGIEAKVITSAMSDVFTVTAASGNGSIDLFVPNDHYTQARQLLFDRR